MARTVTARLGVLEARTAINYLETRARQLDEAAREHAQSGREHARSEAAAMMVDARYLWATALALREGVRRAEKRETREMRRA